MSTSHVSEPKVPGGEPGTPATAPAGKDRGFGHAVAADLQALENDLEQARVLAAEYQRELAGKSNELATLKQLFDRTRRHLIQLQTSITELREERHRLANQAMRADALERKLEQVTVERNHLRDQLGAQQV